MVLKEKAVFHDKHTKPKLAKGQLQLKEIIQLRKRCKIGINNYTINIYIYEKNIFNNNELGSRIDLSLLS